MFLDGREDGMFPCLSYSVLIEVFMHKEAMPNCEVLIGKLAVGGIDNDSNPLEVGSILLQPESEQIIDGWSPWEERHKVEPPPQRRIKEGDCAISRIHRSDEEEV